MGFQKRFRVHGWWLRGRSEQVGEHIAQAAQVAFSDIHVVVTNLIRKNPQTFIQQIRMHSGPQCENMFQPSATF